MAIPIAALVGLWGEPLTGEEFSWILPEQILAISSDSRGDLEGHLFVPLVGERFDGHRFLQQALEAGAVAAVAQRDRLPAQEGERLSRASGKPIWLVEDSLQAFQDLARLWRRGLKAKVVAVTGSAGKTTTREMIRAVLAPLGAVIASSGNENNDVGVPLTLMRADQGSAALVVEMGMRGLGEIERLSRCCEPDVAVITNIGTAHIGRLGSREAIGRAKCEITAALRPDGLIVVPAGDPLLEASLGAVWEGRVRRVALADDLPVVSEACTPADLVGRLDASGETLTLEDGSATGSSGTGLTLPLPLPGRHHARNLLLAVAVALELGLDPKVLGNLSTGLKVELPGGRSRRLLVGGIEVLDDSYNASPEAVLAALELLAGRPQQGGPSGCHAPRRRFAVLGTMLELGARSLELHRAVAQRARDLELDGLLIVDGGDEGEAMLAAAAGLARLERVSSVEEAAVPLRHWLEPGDVVLLKASRGVALERLIPLLG